MAPLVVGGNRLAQISYLACKASSEFCACSESLNLYLFLAHHRREQPAHQPDHCVFEFAAPMIIGRMAPIRKRQAPYGIYRRYREPRHRCSLRALLSPGLPARGRSPDVAASKLPTEPPQSNARAGSRVPRQLLNSVPWLLQTVLSTEAHDKRFPAGLVVGFRRVCVRQPRLFRRDQDRSQTYALHGTRPAGPRIQRGRPAFRPLACRRPNESTPIAGMS